MTTTQTRTGEPPSVSLEIASWTLSARVWVWSVVLTGVVAATVGVVGWFHWDAPFVPTVVETVTTPTGVLAAFLSGRALAFVHCQRRRDRAMAAGTKTLSSNVSLASVVTVASYTIVGLIATGIAMPVAIRPTIVYDATVTTDASETFELSVFVPAASYTIVGLIATGIAMPFLYEVSGSFFYLAAGIAVVATPIGFLLLFYQLTELIAADRYRRGFRVMPAAWFYVASLPWIVLAWLFLTERTALYPPIPPAVRNSTSLIWGEYLTLDAWEVAYAGLCAPTALAFVYTVRRQFEAAIRRVFGV